MLLYIMQYTLPGELLPLSSGATSGGSGGIPYEHEGLTIQILSTHCKRSPDLDSHREKPHPSGKESLVNLYSSARKESSALERRFHFYTRPGRRCGLANQKVIWRKQDVNGNVCSLNERARFKFHFRTGTLRARVPSAAPISPSTHTQNEYERIQHTKERSNQLSVGSL